MNHIPDIGKMVSDTPRTDRWIKNINGWHYVQIERCRELEQELNVANDRIKRLEEELNELRSDEARLVDAELGLERRMKRLEEVGDKMEIYCDTILARDWKEAKEAKP